MENRGFVFVSPVSDDKPQPTQLSRGVTRYRAPELLLEYATFTDKVDIWALGCTAYWLLTRQERFRNDFDACEYSKVFSTCRILVLWANQG